MGKFKGLALDRLMSEANVALDQIDKVRIPANIIDLERRFIERLAAQQIYIFAPPSPHGHALVGETRRLVTGIELQIALSECANNARWLDE